MQQVELVCSRCFRDAPPPGSPAFLEWEGGADLGDLDELTTHLLLCPECREEEKQEEELGGEGEG